MIEPTKKLLRDPSSELVFGLVAPIGADLERLEADLIDQVGLYGYLPRSQWLLDETKAAPCRDQREVEDQQ
jgi:hypothetical protein